MKKVSINTPIAKVNNVAMRMITAFDNQPIADTRLNGYMDELRQKSAAMTTAFKRDKTMSNLDELDAVRDKFWLDLLYMVEGYCHSPFDTVAAAAQKVSAITDKYGAALARESYSVESSLLESVLEDLAQSDIAAATALLSGIPEIVQHLRQAQTDFHQARVRFNEAQAAENALVPATTIKKEVVTLINTIITYLDASLVLDSAKYERFGSVVETLLNE